MIIKVLFFIISFFIVTYGASAQNAPVTTAASVTACPGSVVSVPVTVTGFNNIGAMSLKMDFNPAVIACLSLVNNSGFPGLFVNIDNTLGRLTVGGYSASNGIFYPDNTVLFTVNFNYSGGTSGLSWNDTGSSCEYADFPAYNTLNDIPFSTYYTNGQVSPLLNVDFSADNLFPLMNQTVVFSDLTTGNPSGWNWSIVPGNFIFVNGTNATSQKPQVQFTSNGVFKVTLAATRGSCTISLSRNDYIHCGTKGLWTGITSADWNISSNWHNYMVPESTIDVVIPPNSANWPVYTGDLTIGSQCRSLLLDGISSMMTVTGKLVLLAGGK